MKLRIEDLEATKIFYEKELKDSDLSGGEKTSYIKALGIIEVFILEEIESAINRTSEKY